MRELVILGASRTSIGQFQGQFKDIPAPELGGCAIKGALQTSGIDASDVDSAIMGCVLPAGLGQAPARQAAFHAGLDDSKPALTINKMCGSGMQAVMLAGDQIKAGTADLVMAGGMENMTRAPYLNMDARNGARLGHIEVEDHMFLDGLEDAYDQGCLMGVFAEKCAGHYQFTRQEQDDYALQSLARARKAQEDNAFDEEITPVTIKSRKGDEVIKTDELPLMAKPDRIPTLKPAFQKDGTVTAANASAISDGGAALLISDKEKAESLGAKPQAKILGYSYHAQAPAWFTTAPIKAAQKLMQQLDWSVDDVDLWEVNEAFAVVAMAFIRDMGLTRKNVNIHGGACALGHPIGASGARIVITLLKALERQDKKRGIAAICIGGGEATAIAVERL